MFRHLLILLAALTALPANASSYAVIEDKAITPILTPSLALRKTEKIRLANGLEALIISDPQADKSAAGLVVKTGSWEEPPGEPGLAHFLEHMLFMGTDKYPDENEFDQYVSDHGGSTDAFTADDFTGYIFDVDTSALEGALDRYSRFFKEPRFNPSGVARELKAIDQEYAKNVENDDIREYHILKDLSKSDHPHHRFSMGNSRTLSKVTRDSLVSWYQTHYSANIMRLVVISPLPLEQLKGVVVTAFEGIKNSNRTIRPLEDPSVDPENLARMAYIEPIKNRRNLNIIWEIPPKYIDLEAKPESLICTVLGDEGPKSLLAQLKELGLADALACGLLPMTEKVQKFYITIGLTKEGVKRVDAAIEMVFQAIAALKEKGIPPYIYEDTQGLAKLSYQYQARQIPFNDVMRHAMNIAYEPMETYPEHTYVLQHFDPKLAAEFLGLLTPRNAYYQLTASSALTGVAPDRKEPWLGAEYAVKAIPEETLAAWSKAHPNLNIDLPGANPYIPHKLEIVNAQVEPARPTPMPSLLKADEFGAIYYAPDTQFGLPDVRWQLYLKTPQVNQTPQKAALIDLYARYLSDAIKEATYAAMLAGLQIELAGSDFGLNVKISGYSEKAALLLEAMLKAAKEGAVDADRFERVKLTLQDDYNDSLKSAPYQQAVDWLRSALYKQYARQSDKGKALQKIDLEKFSHFFKTVFSKVYVEGVLYGNITAGQANDTIALLYKGLGSGPYPKGKEISNAALILPADKGPFYFERDTDAQGNAVILTIENGAFDYKAKAAQQILVQAMSAPFFNTLRTQQQTGYIVTNYAIDIEREMFSSFLVQSNTHEPRDLIARFELFLEGYLQELTKTNFPSERFEKIRSSLVAELQRPARNQEEMADLLFKMAFKYKGDFDQIINRIEALRAITYDECVQWAHAQYGTANKRRLAICVKGKIQEGDSLDYQRVNSLKQLRKYSTYNNFENILGR